METKKILGIIFSILFVCAFGFVLSWGIINFNKVKDGWCGFCSVIYGFKWLL